MALPVMHHCLLHFDYAVYLWVSKLRLFIRRLVFPWTGGKKWILDEYQASWD